MATIVTHDDTLCQSHAAASVPQPLMRQWRAFSRYRLTPERKQRHAQQSFETCRRVIVEL